MNVYLKTIERFNKLFDMSEDIEIAFSGGKDSLAMLYTAIPVARKRGKRLRVVFVDEELVSPHTLAMIEGAKKIDVVDFHHLCVPMTDLNGCCKRFPFWFPWHPAERHLWAREKPKDAITDFLGHKFDYDPDYKHPDGLAYKAGGVKEGMTLTTISDSYRESLFKSNEKYHIMAVGLRVRESFARRQTMSQRERFTEKWIFYDRAYPIYDWSAKDCFLLFKKLRDEKADYYFGYNGEYDLMHQLRKSLNMEASMRVGPPLASEALRNIDVYAQYYPEIWAKMLFRAEGIQAAYRNSNSALYGIGNASTFILPKGMVSWKEYAHKAVKNLNQDVQFKTIKNINALIKIHKGKTLDPIPEEGAHPLTGICWKSIAAMSVRGAWRNRLLQTMMAKADPVAKRMGLTLEQTVIRYGTKEYQEKYFGSATFKRRVGRSKSASSK